MVHWLTNLFSPKRARRKSKSRRRKSKSRRRKSKSHRRKSPKKKSRRRGSPKKRRSPRRKSPKRRRSRQRRTTKKRKSKRRKSPSRSSGSKGDILKKKIKSADWFIVTMKGCGYCGDAKKILRSRGQKYKSMVLSDKNKKKIWAVTDKIAKKKYRYFPMIFHKGKFVGGYGELKEKYSR